MKHLLAALLATVLTGASALAGGPVVVVDEVEVVVEDEPASSVGILPLLLIPVAICLLLCNDDEPRPG